MADFHYTNAWSDARRRSRRLLQGARTHSRNLLRGAHRRSRRLLTKLLLSSAILVTGSLCASAQDFALKTNALYWATTTPNLSAEVSLSRKVTLELLGAYNPWNFKDGKKMHMWLAQPAVRYWLCEKFEGHFFGLHAHGGQFYGGFKQKLYDGYLAGGGISYGYDWILSPHWNLEAEIGLGYAYLWYKQQPRVGCIKCRQKEHKHYLGPTRAAITISYNF